MAPPAKRYPGRDRVVSREDARDYLFEKQFRAPPAHPCERPYVIAAIGLPSVLRPHQKPLPVDFEARCRTCEQCLLHRRRLWTARGAAEITGSSRTWFGTLTVEPFHRFTIRLEAMAKCQRTRCEDFSNLDASEQFKYLAEQLNREATLYLKRLRQVSGVKLRYLLVSEAHKDGFPHLHILIHEMNAPIRKALLESQWRYGFSHWRLVDRTEAKAAVYVCKYLAKEAQTRVRASLRYGKPGQPPVMIRKSEGLTRPASEARGRMTSAVEEEGNERSERDKEGTPARMDFGEALP